MRKLPSLLLTAAFLASAAVTPALADDWRGRGDIHHFHEHDFDHWREGRWFHGPHEGRDGWWWTVGGLWYFYPAPVYPYPDPYTPPTVVVETAPVPPTGAPPSYVYYCATPAGYYPYVPQCAVAWQKVVSAHAAAPAAPQSVPAPQAMAPAGSPHDIDVQQLNVFAARLQTIDLNDSHARAKLKDLEKQVEAFRQSLYTKDYNAMDVLKNAEDLKKRIAEQRGRLAKHKGAVPSTPPSAAVTPPPASPPPGTIVTFPPQ
jgi:hypothetical protein